MIASRKVTLSCTSRPHSALQAEVVTLSGTAQDLPTLQEFGEHVILTELSQCVALIGCGGRQLPRPPGIYVERKPARW